MVDDPVPHWSRPLMARSTLAVFVLVLAAHAAIAWWMLGATFGRSRLLTEEPIYVMVVSDSEGESDGDAQEGDDAAAQATGDPTGEPTPSASMPSPTEPMPRPQQDADAADAGASDDSVPPAQSSEEAPKEPVSIAVDKSVHKPVDNPVDKRQRPPETAVPRQTSTQGRDQQRAFPPPAKVAQQPAAQPAAATGTAQASAEPGSNGATTSAGSMAGRGGALTGPRRISNPDYLDGPPAPSYPQSARNRRQQGKVIVRVLISANGTATAVDVLQTSGVDSLDRAALDAVRRVRFRPYAENGVAHDAQVDIPFDFVLRN